MNQPEIEIKEHFLYRAFIFNGKEIGRQWVWEIAFNALKSFVILKLMMAQSRFAFWLLRHNGEPCPHCKKIILIGEWMKGD